MSYPEKAFRTRAGVESEIEVMAAISGKEVSLLRQYQRTFSVLSLVYQEGKEVRAFAFYSHQEGKTQIIFLEGTPGGMEALLDQITTRSKQLGKNEVFLKVGEEHLSLQMLLKKKGTKGYQREGYILFSTYEAPL